MYIPYAALIESHNLEYIGGWQINCFSINNYSLHSPYEMVPEVAEE